MNGFSTIANGNRQAQQRISRRDILPTSVKGRFIAQDLMGNSPATAASFSFNNGVVVTVTSRTISDVSSDIRLGMLPFMIAFFDSDTFGGISPGTNQIPFDTTTGNFDLYGPVAMPNFLVNSERFYVSGGSQIYFATNGNDVVYKTALRNSSGGAQTVQYIVQVRFLQSRGGLTA